MGKKKVDSKPASSSNVKKYGIPYSQNLRRKSPGQGTKIIYFITITHSVSFADIRFQKMDFIFLISMLKKKKKNEVSLVYQILLPA